MDKGGEKSKCKTEERLLQATRVPAADIVDTRRTVLTLWMWSASPTASILRNPQLISKIDETKRAKLLKPA
jgi:hypothetical protein